MFTSFTARTNRSAVAKLQRQLTRGDSLRRRDYANVRLFQILAPSLAARAHVWHNKLNLKDDWVCWDMPYFDAPGSTIIPLPHVAGDPSRHSVNSYDPSSRPVSTNGAHTAPAGSNVCSPRARRTSSASSGGAPRALPSTMFGLDKLQLTSLLQPLPPVTMVFASIEQPEQLLKRRKSLAPRLIHLLNKVVRDALRRCGGYLCRLQEGDLRFMLAFSNPATALEWCLIVQEAAMFLPWPSELLMYPGCIVETDISGEMVFGGPRFKMGVCEGTPRSILPDHTGRADYFGPSVNMAARFADKAAKGGQIACTTEMAQAVVAQWAAAEASAGQASLGTAVDATARAADDINPDPACSLANRGQPIRCPSLRGASACPTADVTQQQPLRQRSTCSAGTPLHKIRELGADLEQGLQQPLGYSSDALLQNASHTAAAVTGTSAFVLQDIQKPSVHVEIHRLGLFNFKGGQPQQEMVQVMLSHLHGRNAFNQHATITPSRKGQMLQKLEGRVGELVAVQLPSLAQEYKLQLPAEPLPARQSRGNSRRAYSTSWATAAGRAAAPDGVGDCAAVEPARKTVLGPASGHMIGGTACGSAAEGHSKDVVEVGIVCNGIEQV